MAFLIEAYSGGVRSMTYKSASRNAWGVSSAKNKKKNNSKKKKLNYNFKEMSSAILRAKTSGNAGKALIMVRCRLAMLRMKLKSSEYDEKEVESAIIHAERLKVVAGKKLKHLQAEERAERGGGDILQAEPDETGEPTEYEKTDSDEMKTDSAEIRELMREMQRLMEEYTEQTMEETDELSEELMETSYEDIEPADLELRKKKHRSDEQRQIAEADMKYLKALFNRLESEKQRIETGVSLEIGGVDMSLALSVPADAGVISEGASVDVKF